jgi:hypothetical protein
MEGLNLGREPVIDIDELTIGLESFNKEDYDSDRPIIYKTNSGFCQINYVGSWWLSRTAGTERPMVQLFDVDVRNSKVQFVEGMLLGTSISGDGNAVNPNILPSGNKLAPLVIELYDRELTQVLIIEKDEEID